MLSNFSYFCYRLLFSKLTFLTKTLSNNIREPSGLNPIQELICVQTDCKCYQMTTKVVASMHRVKLRFIPLFRKKISVLCFNHLSTIYNLQQTTFKKKKLLLNQLNKLSHDISYESSSSRRFTSNAKHLFTSQTNNK